MYRLLTILAVTAIAGSAQQYQRRATMVGGGGGDHGKCTIEVVVDGVAEVEIRGEQGLIHNISGRPAEWRRFECNAPLPQNPADFRFAGVDGRGRQQLLREPRNGGAAVVRIEDPNGGSEGYTFDLVWGGVNVPGRGPDFHPGPPIDNHSRRFTTEQAINVCQDSVRRQALDRFRGRRVEFLKPRIDDSPGRNDFVLGAIDVLRGNGASEGRYRFNCSVNFDTGQVRSVEIDPRPVDSNWHDSDRPTSGGSNRALETCQAAVEARARRDGYERVEFQSLRIDDAPGRSDWVIGNVRGMRGRGPETLSFSCSVDLRSGEVRSVDLVRR